ALFATLRSLTLLSLLSALCRLRLLATCPLLRIRALAVLASLGQSLVHRFDAVHQIARPVSRLRALLLVRVRLRRRSRRRLCELHTLTEIRNVTRNLLFGGFHPIRWSARRHLLRVAQLLLDFSPS